MTTAPARRRCCCRGDDGCGVKGIDVVVVVVVVVVNVVVAVFIMGVRCRLKMTQDLRTRHLLD